MPRYILTADLQVRADLASLRRARRRVQAMLGGVGVPLPMGVTVGGGVGGASGAGVTGGVAAARAAAVATQNLSKQSQQVASSYTKASKAANVFNKSLYQQTRYMSTSVRDIATLTGGLITLHGALILVREGIGGAVKFESQLASMAQITNTNLKTIGSLGNLLIDESQKYGVAASLLAQNAQELLQAGKSIEEVRDAIPTLALLGTNAQVGAEGLTKASKAMIVWSNVFGMSMKETRQAFEKAVRLAKSQYINTAELIDSTTILGSLMEGLNGTFEETLSLVAALRTQTGRPVAEVARGLRTLTTRITRRPQTLRVLEEAGVQVFDVENQFVGIVKVFDQIVKLQERLGATSREGQALQSALAGIRRAEFGAAILEAMPQVHKNLQTISGEINDMERDFQIWSETTQHSANLVVAAFRNMFNEITTESEGFNLLAKSILNVTTNVLDLIAELKSLIPLLATVGLAGFATRRIGGGGLGSAVTGIRAAAVLGSFWQPSREVTKQILPGRLLYDRSGYFQSPVAPLYLPVTERGRLTIGRGLRNVGRFGSYLGRRYGGGLRFGGMVAGGYLASREEPLAKGAGGGLMMASMAGMMGAGGPLSVITGVVAGLAMYREAINKQAQAIIDSELDDNIQDVSEEFQRLSKSMSESRFRNTLEYVASDIKKSMGKISEESKNVGSAWNWAIDIFKRRGDIGEIEIQRREFRMKKMEDLRSSLDEQLADIFGKAAEQGIPRERLSEILREFESQVNLTSFIKTIDAIYTQAKEEAEIREKINVALSNLLSDTSTTLKQYINNIKRFTEPIPSISSPISYIRSNIGMEAPIYSARFARSIRTSGMGNIPGVSKAVVDIQKALSVIKHMVDDEDIIGRSGEEIANQFIQDIKSLDLDKGVVQVIAEKLKELDWTKIEKILTTEGISGVLDEVASSLNEFKKTIEEAESYLREYNKQALNNLQTAFNLFAQVRQSRLGVAGARINILQQQRQFAGLPTLPGLGSVAVQAVVGNTVEELQRELDSLRQGMAAASDVHKGAYAIAINDVIDRLKILADVSGRTSDIMTRLNEVEQSRASKLGVLEEFFGGDIEQRRQIARETMAAQMAVRRGSLLRLPNIEMQQMAVAGLRRFSGVENFMGTGKTGGQLLEDLLAQAGAGWLVPEDVERQNLQQQVLQEQRAALAAQVAIAQEEVRQSRDFLNQLGQLFSDFINKLPHAILQGMRGQIGGNLNIGVPNIQGGNNFQRNINTIVQKFITGQIIGGGGRGGILTAQMPSFITGQFGAPQNLIGTRFHRGKWVTTLEEQRARNRAAFEASQLEKYMHRSQEQMIRKFGHIPEEERERFEKIGGRIQQLRNRAVGIRDDKNLAAQIKDSHKLFSQSVDLFKDSIGVFVNKIADIFGNNNIGAPAPMTNEQLQNIDANAQAFIASINNFENTSNNLSTSLENGSVTITEAVFQFNTDINALDSIMGKFDETVRRLEGVSNGMAEAVQSVPDTIDVNSQHKIDVNINDTGGFANMSEAMADIARQETAKQIKQYSRNLGEFGPHMYGASITPYLSSQR